MEARNYTLNLIDWKEYYWQCRKFLSKMSEDSLTAEEFEKYALIDTTEFLESQRGDYYHPDLATPQEMEGIEDKCKKIYGEAYDEEREECSEEYGWFN